jgi:anti-sigma factor RsiW
VAARAVALRENLPRFAVPSGLEERVRAALPTPHFPVSRAMSRRIFRFAVAAAAVVAALFVGDRFGHARARADRLIDDAVASHVRSLQVAHLTDVASGDQHTVKPWFVGRLDFSPPIADLADVGFPLAGGRLDHVGGRSVAAVVFRRRQHVVNLFLWPTGDAPVASRRAQQGGFNVATWTQGDLNCVAVSEIPAAELAQFVDEFQRATR